MSSLVAERGPIHVHVGATMMMGGEAPALDELLEHVETRLHLVPRFRQRVTPTPLQLTNPKWSDDPDFDLRWHVRHTALPRPGTPAQLRDHVGHVMSEPLDFDRPLWQLHLIEAVEDGRHAYISKTHRALVDGVAAVDVGTILLDPNPEGTDVPHREEPSEPDAPSSELLFVRAASERIRAPLRRARRAAMGAITMPGETASRVTRTTEAFSELAIGDPVCQPSSLDVEIGRDRRVACVRVSVRRPDEHLELGNRISTILVRLPVSVEDPAERLELIRAETERLKQSEQARVASLIVDAAGWTPPTINRLLSGVLARQLVFNLVVSNVPGPQMTFYLLGRPLSAVYPFVPLSAQNHALSIGAVSYDGGVFFGLAGDRRALADIDHLAAALEDALAEQTGA
jgi:diacylglycerol O-acyltransferase / wax synthase